LSIDLQPAPHSKTATFQFPGEPIFGSASVLEVELLGSRRAEFSTVAWQFGLVLLFWLIRNWPMGRKGAVAVLGLALPWAFAPLAPLGLLAHVDGLFLGTLWGLALWFVLWARRTVHFLPKAWRGAACWALAAGAGLWSAAAMAQPAVEPPAEAKPARPAASVVLPYDDSRKPTDAERVFMPFEAFLKLWIAANPEQVPQAPEGAEGAVVEALYAAHVAPSTQPGQRPAVEVTARMVVYSFRDAQVTIPLPLGKVPLASSQFNGGKAPLVTHEEAGAAPFEIVVARRGAHVLDLAFQLPADMAGPAGKFTIPLLPVASGVMRFALPADDLALRVIGASGIFHMNRVDGRQVAAIPIDQGGAVTVAWAPRQVQAAAELSVHAAATTAVIVDDAGLRMPSLFQFTVRQGSIHELSFTVPEGLLVRQIAGLDLAGWELADDARPRELKVFLRRAVNDQTSLQFDLFQARSFTEETQAVALPAFAPRSVTRETGTVGVIAGRQFAVTAGAVAGLLQIEAGQFQAPQPMGQAASAASNTALPATPPQLAYRYTARPFELQLLISRQKPQSKAVAEHAVLLGQRKIHYSSRFELNVAGAPRSEVAIQLPEGFLLYEVLCHDAVDYFVEGAGDAGAQNPGMLHVELAAPRTGTVELIVNGIVPRLPDDPFAQLVAPLPADAAELRSALAVWMAPGLAGRLEDTTGWKSIDPALLPARLRGARAATVQFALTSQVSGIQPVALLLDRVAPRLSADSLVELLVRDASVNYVFYLRWTIALSAGQTFAFTTPDWLEDRLELNAATRGVRLRQVAREKIARNRLRWTVTLEDPHSGVLALVGSAALPSPESGRVAAPQIAFEEVVEVEAARQFRELESQRAYLVLVNQSRQRAALDAAAAVEAMTVDDLPIRLGEEARNQATEVLQVRDRRADLGWQMQPVAQVKALGAAVNHARLSLFIARDGSWRGQADYQINNRSRQFLALRMPAQTRVLSLFLGGAPARPIDPVPAANGLLLIPLPKAAEGDLSTSVSLVYAGRFAGPLPQGVQIMRSEFDLPAPQVVSQAEDPRFGVPVASTEWTVYLPEDLDARKIEDPARSNMSESIEGLDYQIALFQEWLNLYSLLEDHMATRASKMRAQSNLKQLETALGDYKQNLSRLSASQTEASRRQERELRELAGKFERAQSSLSSKAATIKSEEAGRLNAAVAQQQLILDNSVDFARLDAARISEELRQTLSTPASREGPAKAEGKAGRRALKRAELDKQLAEQSNALNVQIVESQRKDSAKPGDAAQRGAQVDVPMSVFAQTDAEEAFQQSQRLRQQRAAGGRAGVMGGGLGGGPAGGGLRVEGQPQQALDELTEFELAGSEWDRTGGLSLKIELPATSNKLTFSRPGGEPRLALGLRPKTSLESAFGLGWAAVWLTLALALVSAFTRGESLAALRRGLPIALAVAGLGWFYLFPYAWLGFVLFVAGALALGWRYRNA
jgi:hypothetical protein